MEKTVLRVYITDMSSYDDEDLYNRYADFFDEKRIQRIERTSNEAKRHEIICTGAMLGMLLKKKRISPDAILYKENGKPYLNGHEDLYFNLSNSGSKVMLAVSGQEIGADIQKQVDFKENVFLRITTENEREGIENPEDSFTLVWAVKEAYLKLLGTGISKDMREVTYEDRNGIKIFDKGILSAYALVVYTDEKYKGVVVSKNPMESLFINEISL